MNSHILYFMILKTDPRQDQCLLLAFKKNFVGGVGWWDGILWSLSLVEHPSRQVSQYWGKNNLNLGEFAAPPKITTMFSLKWNYTNTSMSLVDYPPKDPASHK